MKQPTPNKPDSFLDISPKLFLAGLGVVVIFVSMFYVAVN